MASHSGTSFSITDSAISLHITASSFDSPLSSSVTLSLFHSQFRTYLFRKSYPLIFTSPPRLPSLTITLTVSGELPSFFVFSCFLIFHFSYRALDYAGPPVSFEST